MKQYIARLIPPATACLLLLMAGCTGADSHDPAPEPDPTQVITFGTAAVSNRSITGKSNAQTRSELLTTLSAGKQMKVYGYCVPQQVSNYNNPSPEQAVLPWVQKANYSTPDIFNSTILTVGNDNRPTYDGLLMPWKTASSYPDNPGINTDNFLYTFVSHYPASGAFTYELNDAAGNGKTGAPRFIFDMPAEAASDHDAIPDAMVAATFDHLKADGQVRLTYHHILTALRFRINNYTDKELHIHSLTLRGTFFKRATFDFNEGAITQTTASIDVASFTGNWQLLNSGMSVAGGSSLPLGDGEHGVSVMFLPDPTITPDAGQQTDCIGRDKFIDVAYSLGADGTQQERSIPMTLLFKPAGGTSYALNLNFVGDEFIIYFQSTDLWEHGSDNKIEID